MYILNVIAI